MTREEFTKLYYTMSDGDLGKRLCVHPQTVANKAKRLGLTPKGTGYQYQKQRIYPEKIILID